MTKLIKQTAAAALISGVLVSSAFAMSATSQSVQRSLSDSHVNAQAVSISVRDGVVTLSGSIDDNAARARVAQVAKNSDGVSDVINLVTAN